MRGVALFMSGLLVIAAVTLVAGALMEPILDVVTASEAVQELGWASDAESITDTVLQYAPLLFIAYTLAWGTAWAIRRERRTEVRRR